VTGSESTAEVRALEADDAEAYLELLNRIDRETKFLLWEPDERSITSSMLRERAQQSDRVDRVHLVAVAGGEIVGFLAAHRGPSRRVRHRADFAMGVRTEYQGQGIGRRLLAELDRWAAEVGLSRLELTVMAHNQRAIALYERAGFSHEGNKRAGIRVDGHPVDELVMGKLLG
jgi:RimJ/RimL family protein N-acetyltransferase